MWGVVLDRGQNKERNGKLSIKLNTWMSYSAVLVNNEVDKFAVVSPASVQNMASYFERSVIRSIGKLMSLLCHQIYPSN